MEKIIGLIDKYVPMVAQKYGIVAGIAVAIIIIVAVYFLYSAGWT